ncbi:PepSY-associated TM helix domain-containing protein [Hephaestia sp. GCM10023244]|uniref:PepSY-associated TM helix domain-containing protein n=1 Tax=unclassified Hephaestia TaxID=2631281 RepID=UPI00207768DC|nr:PepSY-associated TM helix domain-containing protein [Hephaestia sp. MAHUQ-44]MCM8729353.1 PepSY domain-containing protein [Hephaestia sp. MAHUQ-44]
MTNRTIKAWYLVHKWTSLVCTAFALMLCITGLPLIFHDEIDAVLDSDPLPAMAADTPLLPLDEMVRAAMRMYPGERPLFLSFDVDRPVVNVTTGPRARSDRNEMHITAIDRRTAQKVADLDETGVMATILSLHVDMFAGLPGKLFLGFMGTLFCVAIVSGVVLYVPFMRRLRFGTVRTLRSKRVKWLDTHNMLGIVTLMWLSVVSVTGVINTLSEPLVDVWRANQLTALTSDYAGKDPVPPASFTSLDSAVATAIGQAPGTTPQFVAFPGVRFTTEHHYAVWLKGATPATRQLLTPALVDARTGDFTAMRTMPWYMLALRLSQPLHFGDYAGLPLKILWALLDIAAIVVLGSGLYLWLGKRRTSIEVRLRELRRGGEPVPVMAPAE